MTRRHWLFMVGAAAMWGASYLFIKVALRDFSEGAIVCVRTPLGAAVLIALAAHWGALRPLREVAPASDLAGARIIGTGDSAAVASQAVARYDSLCR
jgi:drug/metabolite transporter (DMT)-like permease